VNFRVGQVKAGAGASLGMGVGVSRQNVCEVWKAGPKVTVHNGLGTTIWGSSDASLGLVDASA